MKLNKKFYVLITGLVFTTTITASSLINDKEIFNDIEVLNSIEYIEEEYIDLGFDVKHYLPFGFDPYKGMIFELSEIDYIETSEEINLGFDSQPYLPKNFNPYVGQ